MRVRSTIPRALLLTCVALLPNILPSLVVSVVILFLVYVETQTNLKVHTSQAAAHLMPVSFFLLTRRKESVNPTHEAWITHFIRIQECHDALILLDVRGWKRRYHQLLFHDDFLKTYTRIFWKLEEPDTFEQQHYDILWWNNWEYLEEEILISTP